MSRACTTSGEAARAYECCQPRFTSSLSEEHFLAPRHLRIYQVSPALLSAGGAGIGTGELSQRAGWNYVRDIAVTGQVDVNLATLLPSAAPPA